MPYIDIHNERVWIPERPLRSMDEARPMRDGDLWRCPACWARMFRSAPLDGGPATLVCLRCGLERPLEPAAGPPEPYARAVRALDMLADALDEDVMP